MTAAKSAPSEQYRLAARLSREVDLRRVATTRVAAGLEAPVSALEALKEAGGGRLQIQSDEKYAFDEKASLLEVELAFRVGLAPAEQGSKDVFHVEVTLLLAYGVREAPPAKEREEVFEAFATVNGTYNAWPYLREVVSSMAARLGAPPVLLPLFRPEMLQGSGKAGEKA